VINQTFLLCRLTRSPVRDASLTDRFRAQSWSNSNRRRAELQAQPQKVSRFLPIRPFGGGVPATVVDTPELLVRCGPLQQQPV
jgi:hypothetical protein